MRGGLGSDRVAPHECHTILKQEPWMLLIKTVGFNTFVIKFCVDKTPGGYIKFQQMFFHFFVS